MQNYLQKFVEEIIKEAGLDGMPSDFLSEYTAKLAEETQKRLGLVSMAELSPKEVEELSGIMEKTKNDPAAINDYLVSRVDNYEEKMVKALKEFGEEVIASARKLKG